MTTKTRRTIMIERHAVTLSRRRDNGPPVYCERCGAEVSSIAALEIQLSLTGPASESAGNTHFVETIEGRLPLICEGAAETQKSINTQSGEITLEL